MTPFLPHLIYTMAFFFLFFLQWVKLEYKRENERKRKKREKEREKEKRKSYHIHTFAQLSRLSDVNKPIAESLVLPAVDIISCKRLNNRQIER